ncbi:MAG: transcriptional regulator [Deltaproteobacteria bacterium]|nr:transcriptional regulator [Deltaproteobacteria bacterium]
MFDTTKELLDKITLGGDSVLELKEVRFAGGRVNAPHRDSLADELSAFANSRGGVCVLGVEDGTNQIIGIPLDRLAAVEAFARQICNDSIDPPLVAVIQKLLVPTDIGAEVPIVRIDVPKSLFVHKSPGGYVHRIGSSKREMRPEYLARLFQQRSQARLIRFDEQVVPNATLTDLNAELWERFRTARSKAEPDDSILGKLGLARRDEEGTVRPTVAGVLLASDNPRRFLPNAFIQAVAYKGMSSVPGNGTDAYQLDAADISGPIDLQVMDALRFVARNMRTAATKDVGRVDLPQYDLTAVFEALVNAVAHRDYAIHGSKIRLRLFADRLELASPGGLPNTMSVESLALRQSARNEVLTSLLARCSIHSGLSGLETDRSTFMDKRGEGVGIILDRSEQLSGRRPEYCVIDDAELVLTIWAARHSAV